MKVNGASFILRLTSVGRGERIHIYFNINVEKMREKETRMEKIEIM